MKPILATAYDSKYPWGPAWRESLEKHCNIDWEVIDMDAVSTQMPNNIIQHGEFLDFLKPGDPDDVIIFSDADCVLQRPFTQEEIGYLSHFSHGDIGAGLVCGMFHNLNLEAIALGKQKKAPGKEFVSAFRGFEAMPVFCTGVVVATRESWALHRRWFERYWRLVDEVWHHYARIQWLMSYVMQRYMNAIVIPDSFTAHGFGGVAGLAWDGEKAFVNGVEVAIRHAYHLTPEKYNQPPKESQW